VLASAIGLMFGGNPNVIIGDGSLAVVLLMEPASVGVQLRGCMSVPVGGVVVALLFITMHSGDVPSAESRLDVSSCVLREEVDRATDCVCEGWGEGVVVWEQWLVARIFLA
jgi:hypothetical protein